ncbi:MAG TPA: PucR family transcriptional regulator ligand-binding domain-containing protein [Microlunatus sp.]|nr:PucR family transcriptional regulator ligand-binding domain-containing protein [Microlunatus sp.]
MTEATGPGPQDGSPWKVPWTLTVGEALHLEIFGWAESTVVAGAAHLDNVIRWVHSSEIPDIAKFLGGGELLLTAGFGFGKTEREHRAFIRSLAGAGIAALGIEIAGRVFSWLPDAVIDEANTQGLPLIAFGREVSFVEVARQVHNCIVDLRVKELMEDEIATAAFTDLLLQGEDHSAMVEELARRLGHPAVLEDRAHQTRAYYGRTDRADLIVEDWDQHSRQLHDPESSTGCTREPVVLIGETWGHLHVLHTEPLSSSEVYAIGRATAAIAITLLSEQVRGARRSQRDSALISRLMLGDISGDGFVDRAMRLGRDVRGRSFLAVVAGPIEPDIPYGETELGQHLAKIKAPAILADTGDKTVAIIALPPRRGEKAVLDALQSAAGRFGVSRVVPAKQLRVAVQQATNAYDVAGGTDARRLIRFDDLGVLRLLAVLAQGPELASYVEDELGRLLEHDATTANKLLPTLQAFVECDGSKTDAAELLFVHRRTLYNRLERIEALLGLSLDDSADRMRLMMAVRGLDLLNQRAAVRGPADKLTR